MDPIQEAEVATLQPLVSPDEVMLQHYESQLNIYRTEMDMAMRDRNEWLHVLSSMTEEQREHFLAAHAALSEIL